MERCCGRHGVPTIWAFVCGVLLQRTYILKRAVRLGVACAVFRVLLGRFKKERKAMPALALTVDTSSLTALGNDYGFDTIFERQVEALANKNDAVIGISTSGNSENVLRAVNKANTIGAYTIGLLGNDGGKLKDAVNLPIIIPSNDTARIQEVHITIGHIICEIIEEGL